MFCKFCGKPLPENSNYCSYCGSKLNDTPSCEDNNNITNQHTIVLTQKETNSGLRFSLGSFLCCTVVPYISVILSIFGFVMSINPKVKKDKLISVVCNVVTGVVSIMLCVFLAIKGSITA